MIKDKFYGYLNEIGVAEREYCDYNIDVWNKSKNELLRPTIFGDKLKIGKEITVKQNIEDVLQENWELYRELKGKLFEINKHVDEKWCSDYCNDMMEKPCYKCGHYCFRHWTCFLSDMLCQPRKIVENSFGDFYEEIESTKGCYLEDDGKFVKFDTKTAKPIRLIRKLLVKHLPQFVGTFDEACQMASRITQKVKNITGTLYLSIDPLDYLTASDNGFGWTSCQSVLDGSYSCGVLSAMNSPHNFMVYFVPKDREYYHTSYEINDKMWRCFALFNGEDLMMCKSYPYKHNAFTEEAIRWIRELTKVEFEKVRFDNEDDRIVINSGYMYNDASNSNLYTTLLLLNDNLNEKVFDLGVEDIKLLQDGEKPAIDDEECFCSIWSL